MSETTNAPQVAAILSALVDTLVPGDDHFPPASAVGTQGWLLDKLRAHRPADDIAVLTAALGEQFASAAPDARVESVRHLESQHAELFDFVLRAVYFGYYQSPLVVDAIRALGYEYNDAPQPKGYTQPPFDAQINLPANSKGRYIPTDQVTRVDLTGINMEG